MKKLIPLFLICILFLCGCSQCQGVSGWVTGYADTEASSYPVIMIEQENGREYGVVIDDNTFIHSWVEGAEDSIEKLKGGTAENISVSAFSKGRIRNVQTDKGIVKALIADTVSVDSLLQEKVKSLSLENDVIFYGTTNKVNEILQAMDAFVMPSHHEGLGIVLIEAQCAGLYCTASTAVPRLAQITENIQFVSLEETAEKWAGAILSAQAQPVNTDDIMNCRYNVTKTAQFLQNFYLER